MRQQGRDARLRTQPGHGHTCAAGAGGARPWVTQMYLEQRVG